jgi:hypothetical protein
MAYSWQPSFGNNDTGVADLTFSFVTNDGDDPDETLTRGNKVASITYAATGKYTVTLDGGYYEILGVTSHVNADSGGDGAYSAVYIADEAADPLVLTVFTFDATGAEADLTSRRVTVSLKLKLSMGT